MRNKLVLFFAAFAVVALFSCGNKGGKSGLLVPKEAAFVLHINASSLNKKLSWDEIKQTSWFKDALAESKDSLSAQIMNDPKASGVDIEQGFTFFFAMRGKGGYGAFEGGVKDVAAFEAALQKTAKSQTSKKSGDLSYYTSPDEEAVFTWTKDRFVAIFANGEMSNAFGGRSFGGGGRESQYTVDSLLLFAKNTYALKGSDLIDTDSRFTDLMKSDGDVHFWVNSGNLYNNMANGMMSMMKVNNLIEGNISTGTLSFDNGKIVLEGKQYYNDEVAKILKKYSTKPVGDDVINRLPAGDPIVAGVYNVPVEAWIELAKLAGVDGVANSELGREGLSLDDFKKAFNGNLAFALTDIVKRETVDTYSFDGQTSYYPRKKSEPNYVFGIGIKEQESFNKIFSLMEKQMGSSKETIIKNDKNWLVVSSSDANTATFLAGGSKPAYADKIKGHTMGVFLNLQKVITMAKQDEKDSSGLAILDLSLKTWQDAVAYSDYSGNSGSYKIEVNFVDKNTNSLKQLNTYADKAYQLKPKRNYEREEFMLDSVSTMAPPPPPMEDMPKQTR